MVIGVNIGDGPTNLLRFPFNYVEKKNCRFVKNIVTIEQGKFLVKLKNEIKRRKGKKSVLNIARSSKIQNDKEPSEWQT